MKFTLEQALQKGVEAHKAGNVQEADRYYTAILKAQPKQPDANHNMGILAVGFGKTEVALPFFKTALEISPNIEQFWLSYIDALIKLDRIDDAKAVLDQAKNIGLKGDGFDQIEKRLGSSCYKNPNDQGPSQEELNKLAQLYNQNRLQQVFNEAQKLTKRYTQSLTLWNLMGASAAQIGKLDDAILAFQKAISIKPDYAEAYNNMGATLQDQGKLNEAVGAYKKAISIKPDYADASYNLGNALRDQGKLEEAIEAYKKALSIKHDYAEVYNNLGLSLYDQGKLEEAIEAYKKALSIKPDFTEAYNNLGLSLTAQGKLNEAIEAYKKALSVKHDYADALNNIGNVLKEQGKLEEAIGAYLKAISINPNYVDAFFNMGNCLIDQGRLNEALDAYFSAVEIKPNYAAAYNNMGIALKGYVFDKPFSKANKIIIALLDQKIYARPEYIAKAAISLLKLEQTLQKHLNLTDVEVKQSLLGIVEDLNELPLLLKLMSVCPLPDLELEKLLINLRRSILLNMSDIKVASTELLNFQSALALQCFTNEYIYSHTEEEEKILKSLEVIVKKHLANDDQPSPQVVLVLASYKALNCYEWCNLIDVTDRTREVFTRQIEEPLKEKELKSHLPTLKEISDIVSSKVQKQYEENPFPRWINLGLDSKPM